MLFMAQGAMDGVTSLVWGDVGNRDRVIFKFPQTEYIVPQVGVFYLISSLAKSCCISFSR